MAARLRGHGEQSGDAAGAGTQLANRPCHMVCFKALPSNAGNVYLGSSTVTVADGTTDITTGWVLAPGDTSPMFPAENLNEWYIRSDNAGDDIVYILF